MFDMYGKEKDHKIPEGAEVVLLTSVSDFALLAIVRGMLEDENIPYLAVEPHGSAMGMIVGFSMYGADIYISKDDEERGRDLIAALDIEGGSGADVQILDSEDQDQ